MFVHTKMENVLKEGIIKIYLVTKPTKVLHIILNGVITLMEANKIICWVHFEGHVFCNIQSTGGEHSENPSAVYLQHDTNIIRDLTWHEQTWLGMDKLDALTAGDNNKMATYSRQYWTHEKPIRTWHNEQENQ